MMVSRFSCRLTISILIFSATGEACFACELEAEDRVTQPGEARCPRCPNIIFPELTAPTLVQHVGAHILYDSAFKDADNPCGFCLRVSSDCKIYLRKGQSGPQVDMSLSSCLQLRKLSLGAAAKFSPHSPCTNHPMVCTLCPNGTSTVWKYNLRSHIIKVHPTATPLLYKHLYNVAEAEMVLMKGCWNKRRRLTKGKKKRVQNSTMAISEAHTSRITLRYVVSSRFWPILISLPEHKSQMRCQMQTRPTGRRSPALMMNMTSRTCILILTLVTVETNSKFAPITASPTV